LAWFLTAFARVLALQATKDGEFENLLSCALFFVTLTSILSFISTWLEVDYLLEVLSIVLFCLLLQFLSFVKGMSGDSNLPYLFAFYFFL